MDLSIVIPTYNEKDNVSKIIKCVFSEFKKNRIDGELIIVDDNSPDGTSDIVKSLQRKYDVKLIKRSGKLGLSSAVIEGWRKSKGKILGVMDADLSHSTGKIYELFNAINNENYDIAIGSRYVSGGGIRGWGLFRKFCSKGSTVLAKMFTRARDPMSGFFMIRKSSIDLNSLDSKGFKILLEVLVKTKIKKIKEIPIVFINREKGKSKASVREIKYYLINLIGYFKIEYKNLFSFFKFAIVGFLGTILNIVVLYSLTEFLGIYYLVSAIIAFIIAMTHNFILNKIWTFNEIFGFETFEKFFKFFVVSVFALGINLIFLYLLTEFFSIYYLISQIIAIGISLIFNFLGNKFWTFRK